MKTFIGFVVILLTVQAHATQIAFRDLTNLVSDADHVLVGTVTWVDMIDGKGNQVTKETARTGPGSENMLRLHVSVATNGVVASTVGIVPEEITIPLWQNWHDTLGNRKKEVEGKTFIFLLKGPAFQPVYFGLFMREKAERLEIERLLKDKKTPNPLAGTDPVTFSLAPGMGLRVRTGRFQSDSGFRTVASTVQSNERFSTRRIRPLNTPNSLGNPHPRSGAFY